MSKNYEETMQFSMETPNDEKLVDILKHVFDSLNEKGYDPLNQIIGYIISGDPTYITSYNDARKKIKQIDRTDMLETILKAYLKNNNIE